MKVLILIDVLVLTGLTLLAVQNLTAIFLCSGIAAACGLAILYLFLKGTHSLRLTWLLASSLLIGYGGGCFSTMRSVGFSPLFDAFTVFGIPKAWGAYAMVLVLFSCAALLAAGIFEPRLIRDTEPVQISWKAERFLWVSSAIIAAAYIQGDYTMQGTAAEPGTRTVTVLGSVAGALTPVLAPLATLGIFQTSGFRRRRFIFLAAASALAIIPSGRRAFAFTLAISIFAVIRLSGWTPRLTATRKALLGAGFLVVITSASFLFMAMRVAGARTARVSEGGLTYSFARLIPVLLHDVLTDPQELARQVNENLVERPFYLTEYLSLLGRGGDTPSPLWGQDAVFAVQMIIPDAIYKVLGGDKSEIRKIGSEEGLANEHFGLPDSDDANSILTAGIIDFGLLGVFLYPVLCCVVVCGFLALIRTVVEKEGQLVILFIVMNQFLEAETEISSYVSVFKTIVTMAIMWRVLCAVPTLFRMKKDSHEGASEMSLPAQ